MGGCPCNTSLPSGTHIHPGMLMTDQIFLGHLGTVSLAAAALGTTYSNIMWWVAAGLGFIGSSHVPARMPSMFSNLNASLVELLAGSSSLVHPPPSTPWERRRLVRRLS